MEKQTKEHLQKCLFEGKVCNLVTEISSKETGAIPEPNTDVILKRKIIEQTEEDFSYQPLLRKEENAYRFFEPIAKEERLSYQPTSITNNLNKTA